MTLNPDAVFDTLTITKELSVVSGGATEGEISLFAYLSCLLSVYEGNPPSEWGYQFSATHTAAPYSESLASAVDELKISSLLVQSSSGLQLSNGGLEEWNQYASLGRFQARMPYLTGACGSTLLMPLPAVGESISAEPSLRRALELSSKRELLGEGGRETLMEHFRAVSEAVPEADDLMIPAVVWLEYLSTTLDGAGKIRPSEEADDWAV
ncbi:hypothetical protein ACFYZJ_38385 [Streptomyces sp. NPDC001848]|uniref:hypothetical protein n=1 Tax=Streptomyces sp. NPDC001848 TaxID=3364618 RepID=UPI003678BF8C